MSKAAAVTNGNGYHRTTITYETGFPTAYKTDSAFKKFKKMFFAPSPQEARTMSYSQLAMESLDRDNNIYCLKSIIGVFAFMLLMILSMYLAFNLI